MDGALGEQHLAAVDDAALAVGQYQRLFARRQLLEQRRRPADQIWLSTSNNDRARDAVVQTLGAIGATGRACGSGGFIALLLPFTRRWQHKSCQSPAHRFAAIALIRQVSPVGRRL
jgi:hypothetical protein